MKPLILTALLVSLTYGGLSVAQTCNSRIIADAPDSRYTLNTDGTALDKKTGLKWMRCALGQTWNGTTCMGAPKYYRWKSALQTAESTIFAGQSDWRLPNLKELQSLVEHRCAESAINLTVFPNTDELYWSSSPLRGRQRDFALAWTVSFVYGNEDAGDGDDINAVRLVRGG